MTKVEIFKDSENNIIRYKVSGHSGYADKGEDIVCAAVSVLAQTVLISLVKVSDIKEKDLDFYLNDEMGILDVNIPKSIDDITKKEAQIILKTFEVGIKSIIESYPEYVTLKYREV